MGKTKIDATLYHANWCHYCNLFKPEWEKFEQSIPKMNEVSGNILLSAKAYEESELDKNKMPTINEKEIRGFPTIKISVNGKEYEYSGKRTCDVLKETIMKLSKQ